MEQGPAVPHTGRSMFLLSSVVPGGDYQVPVDPVPVATETHFPCQTPAACLLQAHQRGEAHGAAHQDGRPAAVGPALGCRRCCGDLAHLLMPARLAHPSSTRTPVCHQPL